jgi:hypothetical protein
MSELWRMQNHTDPIRHAPRGTTDPDPGFVHNDDTWASSVPVTSPCTEGHWPRKRLMPLAVFLAIMLGPIGLFYVNFLSGVAALIVLPFVVPGLARIVVWIVGGGADAVYAIAVPILWCFTVPWAVIGVRIRNARIDREESKGGRAMSPNTLRTSTG